MIWQKSTFFGFFFFIRELQRGRRVIQIFLPQKRGFRQNASKAQVNVYFFLELEVWRGEKLDVHQNRMSKRLKSKTSKSNTKKTLKNLKKNLLSSKHNAFIWKNVNSLTNRTSDVWCSCYSPRSLQVSTWHLSLSECFKFL